MSYWRSKERRRLLGIAGYEVLLCAPTEALADKLLQVIGQKYSINTNKAHLQNEVMLAQDGDGCWIRINQNARTEILGLLKKALYATSEDMFEESFDELLDEMEETYPQAFKYFEGLYMEKKEFALCFGTSLPVRGNQTNNFVESQFLVTTGVVSWGKQKHKGDGAQVFKVHQKLGVSKWNFPS
ncbi:Hypothetical predicted protein [Paramuricea clavata]|uniref:Uncharacterized protein n=1 Tax=Paramuricea clavata TaxID=317549 RepID=A0A6S7GUF9_PARCT|nr:Hypothetical predicted protein [Paramuricea clavata]